VKIVLLVTAMIIVGRPAPAQTPARPDSLALARRYFAWLYTGKADSLYAHTTDALKKKLQDPEQYREFTSELVSNAGMETEIESEKFVTRNGKTEYWRFARFSLLNEDILLRLVMTDGEIAGLGFNEGWDTPPVDQPKS